jgi:ankyrin repeat protein
MRMHQAGACIVVLGLAMAAWAQDKAMTTTQLDEKLRRAAVSLNLEEVKLLLEQGSCTARGKERALFAAVAAIGSDQAEVKVEPIILALLAAGTNVDAVDYGETPLTAAVRKGREATVRLLLAKGASVRKVSGARLSPLHAAAAHGLVPMARLLLERGAEVNARDNQGRTALLETLAPIKLASGPDKVTMARTLLEAGASTECQGLHCHLYLAAQHPTHSFELVQVLLERGGDAVKAQAPAAMLWAAERGHLELMRLVLPHVQDLNAARDWQKRTALMLAAVGGHTKVLKELLARGADVSLKDSAGRTARQLADEERQMEALAVLVAHAGEKATDLDSGMDVIIWGGGKRPAEAQKWLEGWKAEAADYREWVKLAEGYPSVVESATVAGLKPGFHVALLGVCSPAQTRHALGVLKAFYPGVYARRVTATLKPACPLSSEQWERVAQQSLSTPEGHVLTISEMRQKSTDASRFLVALRRATGERLGWQDEKPDGDEGKCQATLTREKSGFRLHRECELAFCQPGNEEITRIYRAQGGKLTEEVDARAASGNCDTGD